MIFFNKKGMHFSTLLKIVLLIFVLVILIFVVKNWGDWVKVRVDKDICRLSVFSIAKGKELTGGKTVLIKELKCKTEKVTIDGKTTDEINKQIANLLYDCWWQFGEGKFNTVSERWINPIPNEHCFVCSTFQFSEGAKRVYQKETLEFWMEEHEIPSKKITYKEYFEEMAEEDYILIDYDVDPKAKYAVIFAAAEKDHLKLLKAVLILGRFIIQELFTGEIDAEGLLMLPLKGKNIEEYCDALQ